MEINGLVYLLNEAGEALAQAKDHIARLAEENRSLRSSGDAGEHQPEERNHQSRES